MRRAGSRGQQQRRALSMARSLKTSTDSASRKENFTMANTAGAEQIEITPETIGHVLKDNELAVPVHQRSYKWEKEQIQDLFQDLAGAIKDNLAEYFLGSIVVVKADGRLEVNDGQQRLATSLILLAAIRDYFATHNDSKTANAIESDFILTTHRRTGDQIPKLTLNGSGP
jgi:uncharacterized protein with ParB-like and HNH nuclease domain